MEKQKFSSKIINICIVAVIVFVIIFVALMFVVHYDVNGETNMPFQITKINVISTTDGKDVENSEYKWSISAIQNNDIFIYIEKNNEYTKQETISSIKFDDFKIIQNPNIGEIKFFKPVEDTNVLFKNLEENEFTELEFIGADKSDMQNMTISNQGGAIRFRCSNNNIGTFVSNDMEEINYENLLSKMGTLEEDLIFIISFDITIKLDSGKSFKAEDVKIQLPNQNIVSEGKVGKEYEDLDQIIFKRIEN